MGKTYIDTVKYIVYANVEIGGLVEKPDVVGAVFGQTEGLLGDDLDLRELQKNGRIGRIEVDLNPRGGKSVGKIKLPSSLDMVETCILAAALETVDRVGPCEAHLSVDKIEDTRSTKRKLLVDRAKNLLKNLLTHEIPESKEISEQVRAEVKTAEISEYGPEKLPAGPGVAESDSIILVEGRADVINLLKNDISNVVGVGGANVAPSVAKLCREKEVTVFLDGDRGGDIILNELARIADIEFVARAPTGKEVEELTRKELIKCLRSKVPYEQGSTGPGQEERQNGRYRPSFQRNERREGAPGQPYAQPQTYRAQSQPAYQTRSGDMASGRMGRERGRNMANLIQSGNDAPLSAQVAEGILNAPASEPAAFGQPAASDTSASDQPSFSPDNRAGRAFEPAPSERPSRGFSDRRHGRHSGRPQESAPVFEPASAASESSSGGDSAPSDAAPPAPAAPALASVPGPLLTALGELEGTLKARFYSADFSLLKEIAVRDMIRTLEGEPDVFGVVFDGIITQRLADLAENKKAAVLVGMKLGNVFRKPASVLLHTKN